MLMKKLKSLTLPAVVWAIVQMFVIWMLSYDSEIEGMIQILHFIISVLCGIWGMQNWDNVGKSMIHPIEYTMSGPDCVFCTMLDCCIEAPKEYCRNVDQLREHYANVIAMYKEKSYERECREQNQQASETA